MSFLEFQSKIDEVTAAIGEPSLRPAIASHAVECLRNAFRDSRSLNFWARLDWSSWWTSVTPAEFAAGIQTFEATSSQGTSALIAKPIAEAAWKGTTLRLRGDVLQAEGGGYRVTAIRYSEGHTTYNRKLRTEVRQWLVSISDPFKDCLDRNYSRDKKTTTANSEAGAIKSVFRMAKDVIGVDLVKL